MDIKDNNTEVDKSKEDVKLNNEKKTGHKFQKGNKFGKGRPKGTYSFIPMLKRKLKEIDGMTDKTKGEMIIEALINKAIADKDIQAMKEMFNRIDGMPTQKIGGDRDNPIEFKLNGEERETINRFINTYLKNPKGQEE